MAHNYLQDPAFQEELIGLLVRDRAFLKANARLLTEDDFKPDSEPASKDRWVIAQKALDHWNKYREPINQLLPSELKAYIKDARLGEKRTLGLEKLAARLLSKSLTGIEAIGEKLVEFKRDSMLTAAIEEMVQLHSAGELDHAKFLDLARGAVEFEDTNQVAILNYLETLDLRIERRKLGGGEERFPVFFIDPLDAITRGIAKGHLGCIVAPFKRGKSLLLLWIAVAYLIQKLNVMFITLEDPKDDVEDRFDACISNLPLKQLGDKPNTLRKRFALFKRIVRGQLRIVDGTDQEFTIRDIENLWLQERQNGFTADAIIIDYDDEIRPLKKHPERRHEFAEIYRSMRKLAARHHLLVWTAAQTQRKTEDLKVLSGDKLAEDISKARKVACMLTMGQGEWGDDSIYLHVAAHKFDRMHTGCTIYSDKERMIIYDRARTLAKTQELSRAAARKGSKKP
jgi:replicative DNA helicase